MLIELFIRMSSIDRDTEKKTASQWMTCENRSWRRSERGRTEAHSPRKRNRRMHFKWNQTGRKKAKRWRAAAKVGQTDFVFIFTYRWGFSALSAAQPKIFPVGQSYYMIANERETLTQQNFNVRALSHFSSSLEMKSHRIAVDCDFVERGSWNHQIEAD